MWLAGKVIAALGGCRNTPILPLRPLACDRAFCFYSVQLAKGKCAVTCCAFSPVNARWTTPVAMRALPSQLASLKSSFKKATPIDKNSAAVERCERQRAVISRCVPFHGRSLGRTLAFSPLIRDSQGLAVTTYFAVMIAPNLQRWDSRGGAMTLPSLTLQENEIFAISRYVAKSRTVSCR
jgi:hypothetical protein